jgi:hypothetical protein
MSYLLIAEIPLFSMKIKSLKFNGNEFRYILVLGAIVLIILFIIVQKKTDSKFRNGRAINGIKLPIDDSLGSLRGIILKNNHLIIGDKTPILNNNRIRIYSLSNYKLVSSFGRDGSGPGELSHIESLDKVIGNENQISVMDFVDRRLTLWEIKNNYSSELKAVIPLSEGTLYRPKFIYKKSIFSLGFSIPKGRFAICDTLGKIQNYFGKLLPGNKPNVHPLVHNMASEGNLDITPNSEKIILSAVYSDIIDIYDKNGKLEKRFNGPLNLEPKYKLGKMIGKIHAMVLDEETAIVGYVDTDVTNNKIFALYAGHLFRDGYRMEGKEIHIFNIQGELIEKIILDQYLTNICYDEKSNVIYGISKSPMPAIYKFQL